MSAALLLEVVEGPAAGRRVPLDREVVVGRGPDVDLALDDDGKVSRRHARVTPADGAAVVEDLGSSNGTFVNRAAAVGRTVLRPGEELQVGTSVLLLRDAREAARGPSAVRAVPAPLAAPPRPPAYVPEQALGGGAPARTGARAGSTPTWTRGPRRVRAWPRSRSSCSWSSSCSSTWPRSRRSARRRRPG